MSFLKKSIKNFICFLYFKFFENKIKSRVAGSLLKFYVMKTESLNLYSLILLISQYLYKYLASLAK